MKCIRDSEIKYYTKYFSVESQTILCSISDPQLHFISFLTLISRALEKNLQLLFKTILHHDAKYFFKNQKWVKNCMTNLF